MKPRLHNVFCTRVISTLAVAALGAGTADAAENGATGTAGKTLTENGQAENITHVGGGNGGSSAGNL